MKRIIALIILSTIMFSSACAVGCKSVGTESNLNDVYLYGRYLREKNKIVFDNSASGFEVRFSGSTIKAKFICDCENYANVYVDGQLFADGYEIVEGINVLAENLTRGEHTLKLIKRTEQTMPFAVISLITDGKFLPSPALTRKRIVFYGDSTMCGYGVLGVNGFSLVEEDATRAWPYLLCDQLGADAEILARSGITLEKMVNSFDKISLSDDTVWNFAANPADLIVIDLGANDAFGMTTVGAEIFKARYVKFIAKIKSVYNQAAVLCCYGNNDPSGNVEMMCDVIREAAISSGAMFFRQTANFDGADSHPDENGHRQIALETCEFIRNNSLI